MASEKLQIDIQSKFDIKDVQKGVKAIEQDMKGLGSKAKPIFGEIEKSIDKVNNALKRAKTEEHIAQLNAQLNKLNNEMARLKTLGTEGIKTNNSLMASFKSFHGAALMATGALAGAGLTGALKNAIDTSIKYESAMIGLNSVGAKFKIGQDELKEAVVALTKDGLMSMAEASTSLKNLLASGFNLQESVTLIKGFKDSAAFGRQAALGFGEAIASATEGIKNGNSILVDNAGITKNLSVILKEAGKSEQDMMNIRSDASVKAALYNGLLKEMALFTGDAEKYTKTYAGTAAMFDKQLNDLNATIGKLMTTQLEHDGILKNWALMFEKLNSLMTGTNSELGKMSSGIIGAFLPVYGLLNNIGKAGAFISTNTMTTVEQAKALMDAYKNEYGAYMKPDMLKDESLIKRKLISEMSQGELEEEIKKLKEQLKITPGDQIVFIESIKNLLKIYEDELKKFNTEMAGGVKVGKGAPERPVAPFISEDLMKEDRAPVEFYIQMEKEINEARLKQDEEAIALLYQMWDEYDQKRIDAEKEKWDAIQSIAQQGTDVIGDALYNVFMGESVNIQRMFKRMFARMAADLISSGILTLIMQAFNPAAAGVGLFGTLGKIFGFASGVEGLRGAGTETSDSIPARLSRGESVLTAGATRVIQQSMGEGWITAVNKRYGAGRSNLGMGMFAGGIESLPGGRNVVSHEVGDLYIDFGDSVIQKVDYKIRTRGKIKNDRRGMS